MTRPRRPSAQTSAVVVALAAQPTTWRYGTELRQRLDLKPGRPASPRRRLDGRT
jgi:PadR family transcriptional regulator PadR